ncbi:MAG: NAD(P)-dependent oxidoreductase, partial [Polyangiaceae bacterium]|nr:NAD(P)-dependent oxidoreductase [Polyangiaceae bacterium]
VVHAAAEIASQRDARAIQRTNVEGTRALLGACRERALHAFVFISTVVVNDPGGAVLEESKPLEPTTAYGRSKQQNERDVLEAHRTMNLPAVILRPSHIYGPGGWFGELVAEMPRWYFGMPGSGENLWDMVHVDDVAAATVQTGLQPRPGQIFHLVDDEPIRMGDAFAITAEALGCRKPRSVPIWLASMIKGKDPILAATRSARSSNAKAKAELGWTPRYPSSRRAIPEVVRQLKAVPEVVHPVGASA